MYQESSDEWIGCNNSFNDWWRFTIKHHSICIFGEDLRKDITRYKLDYLYNSPWHRKDKYGLRRDLDIIKNYTIKNWNKISENNILNDMTWISKRIIRSGYQLVRDDLTSHNLRGMYASYMFNEHNTDNQNINGFIEKVLNHDSSGSSLNYTNYIYEDGFKSNSKLEEEINKNVEEMEKEEN